MEIVASLRTPFGDLQVERLGDDLRSFFPHPEGKTWGRWKDGDGETRWYLGRLEAVYTPRRMAQRDIRAEVFGVNFRRLGFSLQG